MPIVLPLVIGLGFDTLTACSIVVSGSCVGFASGLMNLYTTVISQKLTGLPLFSGMWLRAIMMVVLYVIGILYICVRAIAAPQIGIKKRLICMLTDKPHVIINPYLEFVGDERMELLDDCMSFPNLQVRASRYRHCILKYLDGILATMRAIDNSESLPVEGNAVWVSSQGRIEPEQVGEPQKQDMAVAGGNLIPFF